jgi:hypothetical protein
MKKFLVVLAAMGSISAAQASTVECESLDGVLKVRANETVMVISDSTIQHGRKTIARFTAEAGTLEALATVAGERFVGDVDLRFNDSGRAGELIGGTKLGELAEITLVNEDAPRTYGQGTYLKLEKRDGSRKFIDMDCQ